jgi:pilus assembly protein CpaB
MLRKVIPWAAAVIVFLLALVLIQPPAQTSVVVAALDLPAGREVGSSDVLLQDVPEDLAPGDALTSVDQAIGRSLSVARSPGDILRTSNLGEPVTLAPNERAIAVHVRDSAGLAGLLTPGDVVGLVAIIQVQTAGGEPGAFSKSTIEPLRVLYLSPEFQARLGATPEADPVTGLPRFTNDRDSEGTVVLAVPTSAQVVFYDFSGRQAPNATVVVNALELLAALDASDFATLSLYLVPDGAGGFATSGLFLPDLVITPQPTPTATSTPEGFRPTATPGG